jgi:hypothetical protein
MSIGKVSEIKFSCEKIKQLNLRNYGKEILKRSVIK